MIVTCSYCGRPAELVNGSEVYPRRLDLAVKQFWRCQPCDALVGCHGTSARPLGNLANSPLRKARMRAHATFDPLWRSGDVKRSEAYQWLAGELGIDSRDCHISLFTEEQCQRTIDLVDERVLQTVVRETAHRSGHE